MKVWYSIFLNTVNNAYHNGTKLSDDALESAAESPSRNKLTQFSWQRASSPGA